MVSEHLFWLTDHLCYVLGCSKKPIDLLFRIVQVKGDSDRSFLQAQVLHQRDTAVMPGTHHDIRCVIQHQCNVVGRQTSDCEGYYAASIFGVLRTVDINTSDLIQPVQQSASKLVFVGFYFIHTSLDQIVCGSS